MIPTVALTYDDGPSFWTDPLLDVLARHDAQATFFVLGQHIAGHEHTLARAVSEGHEIAVHGWNHTRMKGLRKAEIRDQLNNTMNAVSAATGQTPVWWRAPWNEATIKAVTIAESLGLSYAGFTVDGYDVNREPDAIITDVLAGLADGVVVCLHDGIAPNGRQNVMHRDHTIAAVNRILEHCQCVTVSELLA